MARNFSFFDDSRRMQLFSDPTPPPESTRIAPAAKWTGLLAGALLGILIIGLATPQPLQYVVMGIAFMLAAGVSFVGFMSRTWIERNESLRGDMIAFISICLAQVVMLLFFVVVAPQFLSTFWVVTVFFVWGLLFLMYALASAVPAVRMILVIGLFLAVPLSMLALHLYHQQQAARRNTLEKRAMDLGRGVQQWQDQK